MGDKTASSVIMEPILPLIPVIAATVVLFVLCGTFLLLRHRQKSHLKACGGVGIGFCIAFLGRLFVEQRIQSTLLLIGVILIIVGLAPNVMFMILHFRTHKSAKW